MYIRKAVFNILFPYCRDAYKVACLGVTEGDWEALAHEALEGLGLQYNITNNNNNNIFFHKIQKSVYSNFFKCKENELNK
jgi:hypothetical protein